MDEIDQSGIRFTSLFIKSFNIIFACVAIFYFVNCKTTNSKEVFYGGYYCASTFKFESYNLKVPLPNTLVEKNEPLLLHFTNKALTVANAYGMIPLLKRLIEQESLLSKDPSDATQRINYLETKQKILEMIQLANMDIYNSVSEIRCYAERINDITEYLSKNEGAMIRKNTLISISISAAFTVLSGLIQWQPNAIQAAEAIIGGLAVGYTSYKVLEIETKMDYYPINQLLKEVWSKSKSSESISYPIWHLMKQPAIRKRKKGEGVPKSIIDILVERWIEYGYLGKENSKERQSIIKLYFGDGGEHTLLQLENRSDMLRQCATSISLFSEELKSLMDEVSYFPKKK